MAVEGGVVFEGLPAAVDGVYSTRLEIPEIDAGTTFYLWVTAVNAAGESRASNAVRYRRETGPVGQPGRPQLLVE